LCGEIQLRYRIVRCDDRTVGTLAGPVDFGHQLARAPTIEQSGHGRRHGVEASAGDALLRDQP